MLVTVGVSGRCLLLLPLRALHLTIRVTSVLSTVINSEGNKDTMGIAHNEEYSKTFGTKVNGRVPCLYSIKHCMTIGS